MIPLHFAPLQGYTEDAFRRLHHRCVGGATAYHTPFLRWEHGGVRSKDLRDVRPAFNEGVPIVPQVIASSLEEFTALLGVLEPMGYRRVDLNMGCPFPLQARHGRGAGLIARREQVEAILDEMRRRTDWQFSIKLRLGWESPEESLSLLPLLNTAPLAHLTLHPRLGTQGYKGEADVEAFARFAEQCTLPLIYNGDLRTPGDVRRIAERFPHLAGIMIGRGWLGRPSLGKEIEEGREWERHKRIRLAKQIHEQLHAHFAAIIPGEAQLHQKLKTYWDFMEEELGRKAFKKVQKAGNFKNYLRAVEEIL